MGERMTGKRAAKVELPCYVSAAELAHSAGVSTETVAEYAKRRAKRQPRALRQVGGRDYVHLDVAEAYLGRLGLEPSED